MLDFKKKLLKSKDLDEYWKANLADREALIDGI